MIEKEEKFLIHVIFKIEECIILGHPLWWSICCQLIEKIKSKYQKGNDTVYITATHWYLNVFFLSVDFSKTWFYLQGKLQFGCSTAILGYLLLISPIICWPGSLWNKLIWNFNVYFIISVNIENKNMKYYNLLVNNTVCG